MSAINTYTAATQAALYIKSKHIKSMQILKAKGLDKTSDDVQTLIQNTGRNLLNQLKHTKRSVLQYYGYSERILRYAGISTEEQKTLRITNFGSESISFFSMKNTAKNRKTFLEHSQNQKHTDTDALHPSTLLPAEKTCSKEGQEDCASVPCALPEDNDYPSLNFSSTNPDDIIQFIKQHPLAFRSCERFKKQRKSIDRLEAFVLVGGDPKAKSTYLKPADTQVLADLPNYQLAVLADAKAKELFFSNLPKVDFINLQGSTFTNLVYFCLNKILATNLVYMENFPKLKTLLMTNCPKSNLYFDVGSKQSILEHLNISDINSLQLSSNNSDPSVTGLSKILPRINTIRACNIPLVYGREYLFTINGSPVADIIFENLGTRSNSFPSKATSISVTHCPKLKRISVKKIFNITEITVSENPSLNKDSLSVNLWKSE